MASKKDFLVDIAAPSPNGKSPLHSRESNESHFYPVTRAVSFWPIVNGNGATFEEDKLTPLIDSTDDELSFIGKLVNIWHKKGVATGNQIIGTIKDQAVVPHSGIDLMARIDRKAADVYGIKPEDFKQDGEYCASSIEIWCDFEKSVFIAITDPSSDKISDQTSFTPDEAKKLDISRTALTGYKYKDKYTVVESMWPLRCRGLAFMDDPADKTARVFELAASMNRGNMTDEELAAKALTPGKFHADPGFLPDKKPRYMLDDKEHVSLAEGYFGRYKDQYTTEQQAHIEAEIMKAKKRLGMGDVHASMSDDVAGTTPFSYDEFGNNYDDVECSDMGDAECSQLPDNAFAAAYTTADGSARVRKLPLYRSKADLSKGKPEPGLVKAAIDSLNKDRYSGGVDLHPNLHAEAKNNVRKAHKQLFSKGDKSVEPNEKLAIEQAAFEKGVNSKADEIATLTAQIATLTTDLTASKAETVAVQGKHDELATQMTELQTEKASLETKIAEKLADEIANTRFSELEKIEGFTAPGTDEEKAALLDVLKKESETDFKLRHLTEVNASLTRRVTAIPVAKTKEEIASAKEEQASRIAAAVSGIDAVPVFGAKTSDGKDVDPSSFVM